MYLFIATILIAELIIASTLISYIRKLDRHVCELSDMVVSVKPELKRGLAALNQAASKLVKGVDNLINYAKIKREQYMIAAAKNLLMYMLLFMLKGKSRKCASALQLAVTLKDCWDGKHS